MNWYKKAQQRELWQMPATSEEYAKLDIDTVDRMAFGFSRNDVKTLYPNQLNIKWHDDLNNAVEEINLSGLTEEEWAKQINLNEPINVTYEDGKFWVDDGHHRYLAAKILNKPLNISLEIKDKPHRTAILKALQQNKQVPKEVLKDYPNLI